MTEIHNKYALPIGTMVQEYRIIEILGTGSFGIVYKAENKYFSDIVALKEFLPLDLAYRSGKDHRVLPLSSKTAKTYQWARGKFLEEAKTLWELGRSGDHPNIIHVRQFIETNDTAYMVMNFEEGRPLSDILMTDGPLSQGEIMPILNSLLDEMKRVHDAAVCHRDIKPSNILIRFDGSPVLIDFGAARKDPGGTARSTIAVFSPVYAALEQVSPIGEQGPWTDIYGLGATLYQSITGSAPVTAAERLQGKPYLPARAAAAGNYDPVFLSAIDAALGIYPKDRPQSIDEWKAMFANSSGDDEDKTVLRRPSQPPEKLSPQPPPAAVPIPILQIPTVSYSEQNWDPPKADRRQLPAIILFILTAVIGTVWGFFLYTHTHVKKNDLSDSSVTKPVPVVPVPVNETVSGTAGQKEISVNEDKPTPPLPAVPVQATLLIASVPSQAKVFLNDKFIGRTPLNTLADKGPHALHLSLDGYFDWNGAVLVQGKSDIPLKIPLLKRLSIGE